MGDVVRLMIEDEQSDDLLHAAPTIPKPSVTLVSGR